VRPKYRTNVKRAHSNGYNRTRKHTYLNRPVGDELSNQSRTTHFRFPRTRKVSWATNHALADRVINLIFFEITYYYYWKLIKKSILFLKNRCYYRNSQVTGEHRPSPCCLPITCVLCATIIIPSLSSMRASGEPTCHGQSSHRKDLPSK
jgi:hypothetical protein